MPKPRPPSFRALVECMNSAPPAPAAALEARRAAAESSREAAAAIARAAELAGDTDAEALRRLAAIAAALADRMAEPAGEPMRPPRISPRMFNWALKPEPPPSPPPLPPKGRNLKTHATWREPDEHALTLCGRWQSVDDDNVLKLAVKQLVEKKDATIKEMMEGITCESCRNMIRDRYLTGADWKDEMADRMQGYPSSIARMAARPFR